MNLEGVNMLDKYQKEIIEAKERNILVVASPGSGKLQ